MNHPKSRLLWHLASGVQKKYIYEEEADILNVALFGMASKEWKTKNPELA